MVEPLLPDGPDADDQKAIHALNIHGTFFERWCYWTVEQHRVWGVKTANYPVEIGASSNSGRARESALDIWAQLATSGFGPKIVSLLIECKKHNPELARWIFFRKPPQRRYDPWMAWAIGNQTGQGPPSMEQTTLSWDELPITNDARETRADYQSLKREREHGGQRDRQETRTSNASITEASYQIALAIKAIVSAQANLNEARAGQFDASRRTLSYQVFVPAIVTTAQLFVCDFQAADIVPKTGEIPEDKPTLERVDRLLFEYPMPSHLQFEPPNKGIGLDDRQLEQYVRLKILVITSEAFADTLHRLALAGEHGRLFG